MKNITHFYQPQTFEQQWSFVDLIRKNLSQDTSTPATTTYVFLITHKMFRLNCIPPQFTCSQTPDLLANRPKAHSIPKLNRFCKRRKEIRAERLQALKNRLFGPKAHRLILLYFNNVSMDSLRHAKREKITRIDSS